MFRTGVPKAATYLHEQAHSPRSAARDIPVKKEVLLNQLVRNACEDDAGLENQQALEVERALVVQ